MPQKSALSALAVWALMAAAALAAPPLRALIVDGQNNHNIAHVNASSIEGG